MRKSKMNETKSKVNELNEMQIFEIVRIHVGQVKCTHVPIQRLVTKWCSTGTMSETTAGNGIRFKNLCPYICYRK